MVCKHLLAKTRAFSDYVTRPATDLLVLKAAFNKFSDFLFLFFKSFGAEGPNQMWKSTEKKWACDECNDSAVCSVRNSVTLQEKKK